MKCLVGKVVDFEAVVGVSAPSTCGTKIMMCLEDVKTDGKEFREHCWVERKDGMPKKGSRIKFRARVREYRSLDENYKQVTKLGLSKIKQVKEI